jgi:hypothetical protein
VRRLLHAAQFLVDRTEIKGLGIEVAADPFQVFLVFGMLGVARRLQEVFVAGYSAYVFGRTGAGARQAERVTHARLRGKNVFDEDLVLPEVAEIVLVRKPRRLTRDDIAEPLFVFIYRFAQTHVALIRYPVLRAPDEEPVEVGVRPTHDGLQNAVEVGVRPTHDGLQNAVELGKGDVAPHLELTPDGWVRAAEADPELVNLNWSCSSFEHRGFSRAIIKDRG